MLPFSYIGAGTYTNPATAVPVNVALSDKPDWFFLRDISGVFTATAGWGGLTGGSYTANSMISSEWFSSMPAGSFLGTGQANNASAAAALYPRVGTTNGFTFIDPSNPPVFSLNTTGTAINHTTWVLSMTDTHTQNLQVGDTVRLINPVGLLEAGGMTAQITAVSLDTSITLGYIATAVTAGVDFHADGTTFSVLKYIPGQFYPRERQVLFISRATQAKVYFSRPNDFTVGEIVDFIIPVTYGMINMTFRTKLPQGAPRVLAVTNTTTESSITLDLDTTGFPAFVYPTSAKTAGAASPPMCFPAGSGVVPISAANTNPLPPPGTNLQAAFDNRNQFYMNIGSNVVGANSAVMEWVAMKADYSNLSNA